MKLDTAEKILEWAGTTVTEEDKVFWASPEDWKKCHTDDTATAEYLACCVRVTEIVEQMAKSEAFINNPSYQVGRNILAEAAKAEGET